MVPSARRLMESLRDIGYELPTAIADLVDNSIDAAATRIDITVTFDAQDSWIRISDNGTGMTAARMNDAMRYGSDTDYSSASLGKFGLGLKTASLSQCQMLTVATRTSHERRAIEIRRWDLQLVRERDRWELLRLRTGEVPPDVTDPLSESTGTVVMWNRLDRVMSYRIPQGLAAQNGLARLCRDIEEHLGTVFHRFLTGEAARVLPLTITVNGNRVEAWDPFARSESSTKRLGRQELQLFAEGRTHRVVVHPYVLPSQMQFSSVRAWETASGPGKWNRQQGLYIYRGDRLIQSGGWSRLRTPDEHTKLARISLDIDRAADEAFEINVSKMRVNIPATIRDELRAIASAVANRAQATYRQRGEGGQSRAEPASRASGPQSTNGSAPADHAGPPGASSGQPSPGGDEMIPRSFVRRVLERELVGDADSLRRILAALGERATREN